MKRLLMSALIASSCFAMKSGFYIGALGGGNLGLSNQRIDFQASGNIWDISNATSGSSGTSSGSLTGNHSVSKSEIAFTYSAGLRLGYIYNLTPSQALRSYATFGASQVSIGTKSKNSTHYFAPQTYNLYQAGLALDYMLEFAGGFGMFIGLGYEQGFGDFAKQSYAINTQPYGNIGFFSEIGRSGFSVELGAKLPFLPYYSGDPRIRDTDKANKFKYIYISDTLGTEYSSYQDKISTRVFQFYLALNYVF